MSDEITFDVRRDNEKAAAVNEAPLISACVSLREREREIERERERERERKRERERERCSNEK